MHRGLNVAGRGLLAMGLLTLGACAADEAGTQAQADLIAAEVTRLAPALPGATQVPAVVDGERLEARGASLTTRLPLAASGWVELRRSQQEVERGLLVALPAVNDANAVIAGDGTVTYAEGLPATDIAVQAFEHGVRIQTVLHDASAPTEYTYRVALPPGGSIVAKDGALMFTDKDGWPLGMVDPPWAFDSRHRPVPTHFEVRGSEFTQVIAHRRPDVEYPVVADPWLGFDLIDRANWWRATSGWILVVRPTTAARTFNGWFPSVAGWNELYDKWKDHGLDTNLGSMRNQYICHQQFSWFGGGPTWDLEEWRPDVGYASTVAAECNP